MKFRKVVLLVMIVGFGVAVEGISFTRDKLNDGTFDDLRFDFNPGWWDINGHATDFTETESVDPAGIIAIEVTNAYGDVRVSRTDDSKAKIGIALRKAVFSRPDRSPGR